MSGLPPGQGTSALYPVAGGTDAAGRSSQAHSGHFFYAVCMRKGSGVPGRSLIGFWRRRRAGTGDNPIMLGGNVPVAELLQFFRQMGQIVVAIFFFFFLSFNGFGLGQLKSW